VGRPDADRDLARDARIAAEAEHRRKIGAAKAHAKREAAVAKAYQRTIDELEAALGVALRLDAPRPPVAVRVASSRESKAACPIILASDWHVEEPVHPAHVNGMNEYSVAIAKRRAARFVEGVLWLLDTHRSGATIDEAVLGLLGDFITGWIHEELKSGNAMSPSEASEVMLDILRWVIGEILKRAKLRRLRVICSRGNHGRITQKTYINAAARTSFEWLMYRVLAKFFDGDRRVTFTIEDGYHTYVPVYDKVLRFHHGDAVTYQGGVGGLTIPLRKSIARWNRARRADIDFMGHYHQLLYGGDFVVNGSLIGWNDYAAWIGASPEPPQQAFVLIRPGRGVASFDPVFCTE